MWLHHLQEFAMEDASNLYLSLKLSPHHWKQSSQFRRWAQETITQDPQQTPSPIVYAILFTILSSLPARYVRTTYLYREEQARFISCLNLTHT